MITAALKNKLYRLPYKNNWLTCVNCVGNTIEVYKSVSDASESIGSDNNIINMYLIV